MNRSCMLLRLPGYPFAFDALLPDRRLAEAAAVLDAVGARPVVLDLGAPELVQRMYPAEHRAMIQRVADRFLNPVDPGGLADLQVAWALRTAHRAFVKRRDRTCIAVADEVRRRGPSLLCMSVHTMDDVAAARVAAERIAAAGGPTRVVLMGEAAEQWRDRLLDCCPACFGVLWGPLGRVLPRLLQPDRRLADVAGFCMRSGATPSHGATDRDGDPADGNADAPPPPAYDPAIYPALADDKAKLHLFELDDRPAAGRAEPGTPLAYDAENDAGLPSIASHCEVIAAVRRHLGARAFHFRADATGERRVAALLMALAHRGLDPIFSRSSHVAYTSPHAMALLRRSGCEAVRLRIETGSQRLLEDYYGHDTTVTRAEATFRAATDAGLFTAAEFCYPAPVDDRHSAAETLRLAVRTRVDAAIVRQPLPTPGSPWACSPERYGFAPCDPRPPTPTRFPLPVGRWQAPACRHRSRGQGEVVHAQERLIADLAQCGVATTMSEHLALIARALGSGGCAAEFATRVVRMLYTGDAESLRSLVRQFNDAARTMPAPAIQTESSPVRRAVGD